MVELFIGAGVPAGVSLASGVSAIYLMVEMLVWDYMMSGGVIAGVLMVAGVLGRPYSDWYLTLGVWLRM